MSRSHRLQVRPLQSPGARVEESGRQSKGQGEAGRRGLHRGDEPGVQVRRQGFPHHPSFRCGQAEPAAVRAGPDGVCDRGLRAAVVGNVSSGPGGGGDDEPG